MADQGCGKLQGLDGNPRLFQKLNMASQQLLRTCAPIHPRLYRGKKAAILVQQPLQLDHIRQKLFLADNEAHFRIAGLRRPILIGDLWRHGMESSGSPTVGSVSLTIVRFKECPAFANLAKGHCAYPSLATAPFESVSTRVQPAFPGRMPNNPNTLQHRALENQMIQLEGVSRRFHDGHQDILALREVDLEVPQGQIMAILGRSGSGKSTLLHLVAGLDVPDQGRIRVGSTEVQTLTEDRRTAFRLKHIGFVFQFFHLLPGLTAQENVMFPAELAGHPRKEAKARALDLLESVQLGPR